MADTPVNRPAGRQRTGGGMGQSVSTHGPGLGTGPVGKSDAYQGRRQSSGGGAGGAGGGQQRASGSRGLGKGSLILIVIVLIAVVFGGKSLFGGNGGNGGNDVNVTDPPATQAPSSFLSSLLGGYTQNYSGGGNVSSGWTGTNNTGKLNTSVASGARAKRTTILGNGRDVVTIMVYLCGTDLESKSGMASNDLKEMAAATLNSNVNVIVYTGGCKQWKINGISNSVNQIYKLENGQLRLLVKDDGSAAMTNAATLTRFINYCKTNYPANRNELILWDHGGGSVSGYGYDEKNASAGSMTLKSLVSALKSTGMTFDFIGFDACLMATLETAVAVSDYADYLVASEETEPGIGWYYTNWLNKLSQNTSTSTLEIGKQIVDDFVSVCGQKCPGQKATLSVIDLCELSQTVGSALEKFSDSTAELMAGSDYQTVSEARADTKEFATSNKLDQIDLVHFALNLDTADSRALANTLLSAVKYNKVGSGITNAYGISAYFPYRKTNKVSSAIQQLDAIGIDDSYTACIKKFASLEVTGQATSASASTGTATGSPFGSLLGSLMGGGTSSSSGGVTDIIGSLLGGGSTSSGLDLSSLLGGDIFDRSVDEETLISVATDSALDDSLLVWTDVEGGKVLKLSENDWSKVTSVLLNVFLDDGKGYIDLGLDNILYWTPDGDLAAYYDDMWIALNSQPVAYYFVDETVEDGVSVINGRVPVLLNGDRAELLITFTDNAPAVTGVRYFYADGETDTVAKAAEELTEGDVIQPICDRYTYDGEYEDSYMLGDEIVYNGTLTVSDVVLNPNDGDPIATYVLTDVFCVEHWLPEIE